MVEEGRAIVDVEKMKEELLQAKREDYIKRHWKALAKDKVFMEMCDKFVAYLDALIKAEKDGK